MGVIRVVGVRNFCDVSLSCGVETSSRVGRLYIPAPWMHGTAFPLSQFIFESRIHGPVVFSRASSAGSRAGTNEDGYLTTLSITDCESDKNETYVLDVLSIDAVKYARSPNCLRRCYLVAPFLVPFGINRW